MPEGKRKKSKVTPQKVVLEFDMLDPAMKKQVVDCIKRRGKLTITMVHKGGVQGLTNGDGTDGGFQQKVD